MSKSGLSLLELIVVIAIVATLAAIALPRLFSVVEATKMAEALAAITVIRHSVDACSLMKNDSYDDCMTFAQINIDDPSDAPNAHFIYSLGLDAAPGEIYDITASLKDDAGNPSAADYIVYNKGTATQLITGYGIFSHL